MDITFAKEELRKAIIEYYLSLGGTNEEFNLWFAAISQATAGWKMLHENREHIKKINEEYDMKEWFVYAIADTI